ncbi:mitochondrial import receptor subunit TOM20-like [Malus sylvestris]|uniref:mitochondrial import receptor subunit TOM20-like n=1 Tax=Malus sylvestris TaxID=3752 RepID=UPI0021ABE5E7|nr:mitochondrial import receptor subunit TOM20-like [Malus sylvestris]
MVLHPLVAYNLTRWAGALLELSQFQNVLESKKMTQDAISKLEEALLINPRKHDALWCLGNAQTARTFSAPDQNEARVYFERASQCFQKALNEEPGNDLYRKSFEVAAKGPQLYSDLRKHGLGQLGMEAAAGARAGAGPSASIGGKTTKKNKCSNLKYDVCGWIIFAVGIFAWLRYAKSHAPPPPLPQ